MDEFTAEIIAGRQDEYMSMPSSPEQQRHPIVPHTHDSEPEPAARQPPASNDPEPPHTPRMGFRGGFAAIRERANIQDRLVEKLLERVIPADDNAGTDAPISTDPHAPAFAQRPNFNITTMSNNFRRFNARIGVVFAFQDEVLRVLSWHRYSHTLSLLAVYTFVCLDPHLLFVLPLAILLLGVFVPAFIARHPAPPKTVSWASENNISYSPRGPPLAPAATVRPAKELSRDFFRNMRDLQNCMEDFSVAHDKVVGFGVPLTNFSNEALSSAIFQGLVVGGIFMTVAARHLPWRVIFLALGWVAVAMGHPAVARYLASASQQRAFQDREKEARSWLDNWASTDVILDSAPETREVEIFELQRDSSGSAGSHHADAEGAGEWEPWLFSPSPYDPLSHARIAGERAQGTRFFEDVMAPEGWEWSEKKWALDLWSREWVEERIITGVEVETEGERWVYDIFVEKTDRTGVAEPQGQQDGTSPSGVRSWTTVKNPSAPGPSWEEGEDSTERRGEWRRRRWVRLVKRKAE